MQCENACCVSFFDKLQVTAEEKKILEDEAKKRNLKIEISKEEISKPENIEEDFFSYFLTINPCPFYQGGCSINEIKPVMCKIYPIRNVKQVSKKEYYFVIDHKCNWVKRNSEILEHPYRNLFKIFKNEFNTYLNSFVKLLSILID